MIEIRAWDVVRADDAGQLRRKTLLRDVRERRWNLGFLGSYGRSLVQYSCHFVQGVPQRCVARCPFAFSPNLIGDVVESLCLIRTAGNGCALYYSIVAWSRYHTHLSPDTYILVKVGRPPEVAGAGSCWFALNSTLSVPTIVLSGILEIVVPTIELLGPVKPGSPLAPELLPGRPLQGRSVVSMDRWAGLVRFVCWLAVRVCGWRARCGVELATCLIGADGEKGAGTNGPGTNARFRWACGCQARDLLQIPE